MSEYIELNRAHVRGSAAQTHVLFDVVCFDFGEKDCLASAIAMNTPVCDCNTCL